MLVIRSQLNGNVRQRPTSFMNSDYRTSARAYLQRARRELASNDLSRWFYAAFELRAGIEARLQEYLENQEHVPEGRKSDWQIARLGASVTKAFASNSVARVQITGGGVGADIITLYYTPVSPELQKLAQQLGDYLHASQYREPGDPWWSSLRTTVEVGCHLLEEATVGTLLGPPLINTKTGRLHLPLELLPGSKASDFGSVGDNGVLDIRYFDNLADARGDAA